MAARQQRVLTRWELGECLCGCADKLLDTEKELKQGGYPKLARMLRECRLTIGDHFNELGEHDFGLPAHKKKRKRHAK